MTTSLLSFSPGPRFASALLATLGLLLPAAGQAQAPAKIDPQQLWKDSSPSFAVVEGSGFKGAGFLCKIKNQVHLVTSSSVLSKTGSTPSVMVGERKVVVSEYVYSPDSGLVFGKIANLSPDLKALEIDPEAATIKTEEYVTSGSPDGRLYRSRLASISFTELLPYIALEGAANYYIFPAADGCPILREKTGKVVAVAAPGMKYASLKDIQTDSRNGKKRNFAYDKLSAPRIDQVEIEKLKVWSGKSINPFDCWEEVRKSVVTIDGNTRSGFGFIASYNKNLCVITTDDVLIRTGAKTVKTSAGESISGLIFYTSRESNICLARLGTLPKGAEALEVTPSGSEAVANYDVVTGNANNDLYKLPISPSDLSNALTAEAIVSLAAKPELFPASGMPMVSMRKKQAIGVICQTPTPESYATLEFNTRSNSFTFGAAADNSPLTFQRLDLLTKDKWVDWTHWDEKVNQLAYKSNQFKAFVDSPQSSIKDRELSRLWKGYLDDSSRTKMNDDFYARCRLTFVESLGKYIGTGVNEVKKEIPALGGTKLVLAQQLIKSREKIIDDFNVKVDAFARALPSAQSSQSDAPQVKYPKVTIVTDF